MLSKTGLAGTISNDWPRNHDYRPFGRNSCPMLRRCSECDVVVFFRDQEMTIRCRDYEQAVKWARIECKSYKVADGFTVER
jgi:hypothetical protein